MHSSDQVLLYPGPGKNRRLPRLTAERYRDQAVVFWTFTLEQRSQGWLTPLFHQEFRGWLLHAAAREDLLCPAYCLMPDHAHFLWMGLNAESDQLNAVRFLRTEFNRGLHRASQRETASSPTTADWRLQQRAYDHVLRAAERERGALQRICEYILKNPVRALLTENAASYPYAGATVPGYPTLHPGQTTFWPLFWRLYEKGLNRWSWLCGAS